MKQENYYQIIAKKKIYRVKNVSVEGRERRGLLKWDGRKGDEDRLWLTYVMYGRKGSYMAVSFPFVFIFVDVIFSNIYYFWTKLPTSNSYCTILPPQICLEPYSLSNCNSFPGSFSLSLSMLLLVSELLLCNICSSVFSLDDFFVIYLWYSVVCTYMS